MIKAIIFDSDDTILDFSSVACPVIKETAQKLRLRMPEDDEINRLWGSPFNIFLKKLWHDDVDANKFEMLYYSLIEECHFNEIDGAKEVLTLLYGRYILGVLTAKSEHLMCHNFKDAGFDLHLFKFMYGAEHSPHRKPDPRVFDNSLELLKLEPEKVLYVGDSMFDYEAAKNARINFVAVETGYYKKRDFVDRGLEPQNIIKSVKNLPSWLNQAWASFYSSVNFSR